MPDMPNIQLEILNWIDEHADGEYDGVNLRNFVENSNYDAQRVAKKAADTGVLSWGINSLHPWYEDEQAFKDRINELSQ